MSAERMPQAEESSFLAGPLRWATALVVRFPMPVLVVSIAMSAAAVVLALGGLGFRTSRLDLINPKSSFNQLWLEYIKDFGNADDVIVVVEGPDQQSVVPALDELARSIAREDHDFEAVLHRIDVSKIRAKGLHYLSQPELSSIEQFLSEAEPIVRGDWARLRLGSMVQEMSARLAFSARSGNPAFQAAIQDQLDRLDQSLFVALNQPGQYLSPWPDPTSSSSAGGKGDSPLSQMTSEHLLTDGGRMGFVLLRLVPHHQEGQQDLAHGSEAIDELRRLISSVQARHPQTNIGLTGLPVLENDEMRGSQTEMGEATALSLVGVALVFVAGFGGLRHPLSAVAALMLALVWSLGYTTLSVGHVNILSICFAAMLIGVGDFGMHYVARYLQLRREGQPPAEALLETAEAVGPGIVTGALSIAVVFFMAGLTEFLGVAELGIIAGGGILLCGVAAILVLPAMLHLLDARRPDQPVPAPLNLDGWMRPLLAQPAALLLVTVAGTLALSLGTVDFFQRGWYDHNLLHLQPEGLESAELEQKVLAKSDRSVWFAISVAQSREELLDRKARFAALPSVERVEEISSLIPPYDPSKQAVISRIRHCLADLPDMPPQIPVDRPEELDGALAGAQTLVAGIPAAGQISRHLEQVRAALRNLSMADCYRRISEYQQRVAGDLLARLDALRASANPESPTWSDLPAGLVTRFVSRDGKKHLLKVYAKEDIWNMDAMEQFVHEVRSVDRRATGNPLQTYEASRQMQRSYIQAAWYALIGTLIVVYLDFHSIGYTLMAMLPLAVGLLQMFGILGFLKMPLNPANMIVLPLMLGIGVENGVHIMHDFRQCRGRYRMSPSVATAVLLTSLTNMVGFGSLMIASHRGLQSLGRVLTISMSCCLFASLVMLPALLALVSRNRPEEESEGGQPEPAGGEFYRVDPAHYTDTDGHAADQPGRSRRHAA